MALIKCPECGKEMSEYAKECPNCFCPIEKVIAISARRILTRLKIDEVKKLYEVSEINLSEDDTVEINGIKFYVLQVQDNKAELITKDIFPIPFNDGNNLIDRLNGNDYSKSLMCQWINTFYLNKLASSNIVKVVETEVHYLKEHYPQLTSKEDIFITKQRMFALDYLEAQKYHDKFVFNIRPFDDSKYGNVYGFFVAGSINDGFSGEMQDRGIAINCQGGVVAWNINGLGCRPACWIEYK